MNSAARKFASSCSLSSWHLRQIRCLWTIGVGGPRLSKSNKPWIDALRLPSRARSMAPRPDLAAKVHPIRRQTFERSYGDAGLTIN